MRILCLKGSVPKVVFEEERDGKLKEERIARNI
jgi:hypothetical protein